jgi:hypothetical protein
MPVVGCMPLRFITPSRSTGLARPLRFAHALVDAGYLLHPPPTLAMFQVENLVRRPVEVIGDEGYLLVQRLEGVA